MIKTTWATRPDRAGGLQLREAYQARGLTRAQAAAAMDISFVRLWLLETGEVTMVDPAMWDEAILRIRSAPSRPGPFA